ncbi:aldo/keto reductase [Actinocrispum sp. NPDC049592]|uniref:aldo/keto reductase n=1 Tax=Actinocrispum sp. NPDC049592 TaxID=3154835 RepID=UPI00341F1DE3
MVDVPELTLNDGHKIPQFGLGVWQVPNAVVADAVTTALDVGYRSVDTAALYRNEQGVGLALASSPVPRSDLFITTKLLGNSNSYDNAMRGFDESMDRLKLDYLDLYLIHWPGGSDFAGSWKAFTEIQASGRVRSIGVSNFEIPHLRRIIDETGVVPAVNQIRLHPGEPETQLRAFHAEHGILTEAYSPLAVGALIKDRTAAQIAHKYGRTPAQVLLRWNVQQGNRVIPKSITPSRIRENLNIFDFTLSDEDMDTLTNL